MQLFMRRPHLDALPDMPSLPSGYHLRTMRESEAGSVAELLKLTFEDPDWTAERVLQEFVTAPDVVTTFVIEQGGEIVATASSRLLPQAYPGSGYVHYVAAHPAHGRRRLGYVATLATLHNFVRLGCADAVLETDDFRLPAIKIYFDLGFVPESRHESHPARWAAIEAQLSAASSPQGS